jgi:TPR repeat protein
VSTVNWQVTHDRTEGIRLLQRGAAGGSPFANLAMGFRCASSAGGRARARAGLGWAGLGWAGLGWAGLGWRWAQRPRAQEGWLRATAYRCRRATGALPPLPHAVTYPGPSQPTTLVRYMAGAGVVESCPTSGVYYEAAALSAREWLDLRRQRSVEQSNPTEQEHLTLLARNMPPRDKMDAANVEYIDYCAAIGDVQGQLGMGQLLHAGSHGVTQDRGAAAHWFRSAAALGEGMGHANDGMMRLREGRDAAGAVRALRRAAKLQDPSGWAGLAYAHLYGAGVKQSDEMAARAMCMAAQSGHLDSIFNIGVLWLQGRGVAKRDVRKAFHCFSVAAEFSHAHAQLHVGRMALRGLGVRKNCQTAQFFLKHAAEQGGVVRSLMSTALAAHDAGSTQRASLHYLLAAHAGVEAAQANAGYLYAHELTRLRPEQAALFKQKAALLLQQAAVQGSTDAQVQLGVLLAQPPGADHALANKLLLEAAQARARQTPRAHTCTHTYAHTCTHTYTHTHAHTYTWTHARTHHLPSALAVGLARRALPPGLRAHARPRCRRQHQAGVGVLCARQLRLAPRAPLARRGRHAAPRQGRLRGARARPKSAVGLPRPPVRPARPPAASDPPPPPPRPAAARWLGGREECPRRVAAEQRLLALWLTPSPPTPTPHHPPPASDPPGARAAAHWRGARAARQLGPRN